VNTFRQFSQLPITSIKARGWLRRFLEKQRDGLTGHCEVAGMPFGIVTWSGGQENNTYRAQWEPYEADGYWIDGMIKAGLLLDDSFLIDKARGRIHHVLDNPDSDGFLGPQALKTRPTHDTALGGYYQRNRWPYAVFFRAFMAEYDATAARGICEALAGHYLSNTGSHSIGRDVINIETMLWAYEKTGNKELLDYALKSYKEFNENEKRCTIDAFLSDERHGDHGVTYNEMAKLGAIVYMYTGEKRMLDASINAYRKLDRDQMLASGVCSSSEKLRGKDPLDSAEVCDIADMTWSMGYMLMVTGDVSYADKIERACFNAGPGAMKSDFKALQYFSCPNQVIADRRSNHNETFEGLKHLSFRPKPGTQCCTGNVHRIMPNYGARMWLQSPDGGIVAALYGPSSVSFSADDGTEVVVEEETDYPFSEKITVTVKAEKQVGFPLYLRIPAWCENATLMIETSGGETRCESCEKATFHKIERVFSNGDRIVLTLPMRLALSRWPYGGIGIERGPLAYSLRIEEDWRRDTDDPSSTDEFPAWDLYAASDWNYALGVDEDSLNEKVEIIEKQPGLDPWSIDTAPIELKVPARKVNGWELRKVTAVEREIGDGEGNEQLGREQKGDFCFTPQLPEPEKLGEMLSDVEETVTLVPYGCTHLRITVFPQAKQI
jgi:hypothetical protein